VPMRRRHPIFYNHRGKPGRIFHGCGYLDGAAEVIVHHTELQDELLEVFGGAVGVVEEH